MKTEFTGMNNFVSGSLKGEITCPICGKTFAPAPEHAYYIKNNRSTLVCTYTCMRKWDKGEVKELKTRKIKPRRYKGVRIVETGEIFNNARECANHLNSGISSVYKAICQKVTCHGFHIEAIEEGEAV